MRKSNVRGHTLSDDLDPPTSSMVISTAGKLQTPERCVDAHQPSALGQTPATTDRGAASEVSWSAARSVAMEGIIFEILQPGLFREGLCIFPPNDSSPSHRVQAVRRGFRMLVEEVAPVPLAGGTSPRPTPEPGARRSTGLLRWIGVRGNGDRRRGGGGSVTRHLPIVGIQSGTDEKRTALLGSVPVAVIYSFFVDYYVAGLTAGSVKN